MSPSNTSLLSHTDDLRSLSHGTRCDAVPSTVASGLVVPSSAGDVEYAQLDQAASTPALSSVLDAVIAASRTYSSVHRGNGFASRVTSAWYEDARTEVAEFVGARDDDLVVFTRHTTDSWNLLAHALPSDTTVIVFAAEHHSTLLPWPSDRTVVRPVPTSLDGALTDLRTALGEASTEHTLVVLTGASNVTGEVWPLPEVVGIVREAGARLALDAAQLAPHRVIDLRAEDVDYIAFSGHKLYAPYGTGVLAGRADWLDAADPYLPGGGAATQVSAQNGVKWASGAARHEGGSPNVIGAIALAAACSSLRQHRAAVTAHEQALTERLRSGLAAIDGVRTLALFEADPRVDRVGVVAFTIDGLDSSLVSTALSVEHGIGVRDGKFCAHRLVDQLLAGTNHTTAVRASIGLATTAEHIERLLTAVAGLAASGPRLVYEHTNHGWTPEQDPRAVKITRPW